MTSDIVFTYQDHPAITLDKRRRELVAEPIFGRTVTDHMATVRWTVERGWHDAAVAPYQPYVLDPCAAVLHYGQAIFEGMKAYRNREGGLSLFRPFDNANRFATSASRLGMPEVPGMLFVEAVERLAKIDDGWVGTGKQSLYLRPFLFADEAFLGVRAANSYVFSVVAAPVGDYFRDGKDLSIWVTEEYTRAAPGGTGAAKCGGNYAGALVAQQEAAAHGCDQVLFLDAVHRQYAEELGGMNIFFALNDGSVITPPLSGTILPGITRDSLIRLCRDRGLTVREEPYAIDQIRKDAEKGLLREMFACGTAVVVHPIGSLVRKQGRIEVAGGDLTAALRRELVGIQRGEVDDRYGWVHPVR